MNDGSALNTDPLSMKDLTSAVKDLRRQTPHVQTYGTSPTTFTPNKYELYGHQITISDDCIKCAVCDEAKEIPEMFQESSGFNIVLYKMSILDQFRAMYCKPDTATGGVDKIDGVPVVNNNDTWMGQYFYDSNGNRHPMDLGDRKL